MKRLIQLSLILFISITVNGQKIAKIEIDDFTGSKIIETSWESVHKKTIKNLPCYIRFRAVDGHIFINLKIITMNVCSMDEGNKLMFKCTDGIHEVSNLKYTLTGSGDGAIGLNGSNAQGLSLSFIGNTDFLIDNQIEKLRIYLSDGYSEIEIDKKGSKKITDLYNIFIKELNK